MRGDAHVTPTDVSSAPLLDQQTSKKDVGCACFRRDTTQEHKELPMAKGKRTFQPNNRRRSRVHGFRLRMRTRAGRAIVNGRRSKGRANLTA